MSRRRRIITWDWRDYADGKWVRILTVYCHGAECGHYFTHHYSDYDPAYICGKMRAIRKRAAEILAAHYAGVEP